MNLSRSIGTRSSAVAGRKWSRGPFRRLPRRRSNTACRCSWTSLQDQLRLGLTSTPEISRTAILHGHDLLLQGFTVSQVVHDYGDVCQAITELAVKLNAPISTDDFRTLNRCLDDAIAGAVTEFGRQQNQTTVEGETARAGFLAHEVRNLVNIALVAFEVLKTGNVGVAGSTGAVLHRSLMGLRELSSVRAPSRRFVSRTACRIESSSSCLNSSQNSPPPRHWKHSAVASPSRYCPWRTA